MDNRDGKLLPGAYGEVTMKLNTGVASLIIPVSTMIFRAQGLQVATVNNGKAKLVPITIGQDDGRVIQVVSGLTADAQVIQNPPDSVFDGEAVHVVQPQGGAGSGDASGENDAAQQQTGSHESGQKANAAQGDASNAGGAKR